MLRLGVIFVLLSSVLCDDTKVVKLDYGIVSGEKYWNGDFYEFYGVPYASIPTGRDRFKGPLPPKPWEGVLAASKKSIICHQCYYTGDADEIMLDGDEDCLLMNVLSPLLASEDNLLPVVVYIHSGAFSGGSGNMAIFHYLARHDVVTVSFNYRLGALGFACLGNEEIPGNAGLKDQVAALRWIQDNIKKFGGDPKRVTLAGFSVGAAMAELLSFSKSTIGLFDKLILESGSAFSPFTINRDPIATAKNLAYAMGYNGTDSIKELTDFYLNAEVKILAEKSVNYHLKNSTFGFAPCIENLHEGMEAILLESPIDVVKKGEQNDVAVLTGFSNMEGISRTVKFGAWREDMNDNFADFLPADLRFDSEKSKDDFIKSVEKRYFKNKEINAESLQDYVDYFSDSMFKYGIMKSAKLHATLSKRPVYLYEFTYVGKLNIEHNYMDRLKGASHRDQTAYVLDFFGHTNNYKDLDMRERMTTMWTDFVKYENPTPFESSLITVKWLPYTNEKRNYLEINKKMVPKKDLFEDVYKFWSNIYEKFYWNPVAPKFVKIENKDDIAKPQSKTNSDNKPATGIRSKSMVKPEKDVKTNINVKPETVAEPNGGVNLDNDVKPKSDIKPNNDVKHNNNVETDKDVKFKGDASTNNEVKPSIDVKPKDNKDKSDDKSGNNLKNDVQPSSNVKPKIDCKADSGVKPKSDIKPNNDVKPNNNVETDKDVKFKGDASTNNEVKPSIDVKPKNNEDKSDDKSGNNLKDDVQPSSNVKPKIVSIPDSGEKSKSDIKPNNDVKPNNNIKPRSDIRIKGEASTNNEAEPKMVVKPNNIKPKSDAKSDNDVKHIKSNSNAQLNADIKPKNNVKENNNPTLETDVNSKVDNKPKSKVGTDSDIKSKGDANTNNDIKSKTNVKPNAVNPNNNVKTNSNIKTKMVTKPEGMEPINDLKLKKDAELNENIKPKIDVKPNPAVKPKDNIKLANDVKPKSDVTPKDDVNSNSKVNPKQ